MIDESIKQKIIADYLSGFSIIKIVKKYNIPCNKIIESIKDTSKWKNYIKKINENSKNNFDSFKKEYECIWFKNDTSTQKGT